MLRGMFFTVITLNPYSLYSWRGKGYGRALFPVKKIIFRGGNTFINEYNIYIPLHRTEEYIYTLFVRE